MNDRLGHRARSSSSGRGHCRVRLRGRSRCRARPSPRGRERSRRARAPVREHVEVVRRMVLAEADQPDARFGGILAAGRDDVANRFLDLAHPLGVVVHPVNRRGDAEHVPAGPAQLCLIITLRSATVHGSRIVRGRSAEPSTMTTSSASSSARRMVARWPLCSGITRPSVNDEIELGGRGRRLGAVRIPGLPRMV